jgi:hypothetical protein
MTTEHSLTVSVQRTKLTAFQGQEAARSKIETENKIMEQLNTCNYLGNLTSYEKEIDIDNKINNYLKITCIINNMFIQQIKKKKKI